MYISWSLTKHCRFLGFVGKSEVGTDIAKCCFAFPSSKFRETWREFIVRLFRSCWAFEKPMLYSFFLTEIWVSVHFLQESLQVWLVFRRLLVGRILKISAAHPNNLDLNNSLPFRLWDASCRSNSPQMPSPKLRLLQNLAARSRGGVRRVEFSKNK